ncbi:MAG: acetylornithine deacetylase [Nevskiales bacterium]
MTAKLPTCQQMIAGLIALPSISSLDPHLDHSNRPMAERLAAWLTDLGFDCELLPLPGQPGKVNLLATLGQGPGGLVLAGHLDTVPFDEGAWRSDPFRLTERDGRLHGLGTSDMKSFLALAVEAAREFAGKPLQHPLIILGTADEEISLEGARALAQAGRDLSIRAARHAVIGEPTGLRPVRIHKGNLAESIRVQGKSGHASNPGLGLNAVEGMHRVLQALLAFRDELAQGRQSAMFTVPHGTLNPGCIHGGDAPNRIPACCELRVDLRFLPGTDLVGLRTELRQRAGAALAGTDYRIEFDSLYPGCPAFETPATAAIVKACEELTGHAAGAVDFATEGAIFNGMGIETVVLGPGDIAQAHQPDEYLSLDRIEPTVRLLRRLIQRFCI